MISGNFRKGIKLSMEKKNRLDKTSIVMITVFAVLIIGSAVGFGFAANRTSQQNNVPEENQTAETPAEDITEIVTEMQSENKEGSLSVEDIMKAIPNAVPGNTYTYYDDGEMYSITIPADYKGEAETPDVPSKYQFENYTDLTDKFMEACKEGDVDTLYDIYYDDFLNMTRENMDPVPEKEMFDANIRNEMLNIVDFEEFEFGGPELLATQSPGSYVAYIYYQANNKHDLPLKDSDIQNCVDLRVYTSNGGFTDHMMAQIGGYWYFIV